MKRIYLLSIVLVFVSCNHFFRTTSVVIINRTEVKIDSLQILPNANSKKLSLSIGETSIYKLDLSSTEKVDGSYQLSYKVNDSLITKQFGYYSNGVPIEDKIIVIIEKDEVIVKYKH